MTVHPLDRLSRMASGLFLFDRKSATFALFVSSSVWVARKAGQALQSVPRYAFISFITISFLSPYTAVILPI
jgi:hypothetical protein